MKIELGKKLICKETGQDVFVTNVDNDFIEFTGAQFEGSVRAELLEDFYLVSDENKGPDTHTQ